MDDKTRQREYVGAAFYTAPNDIVLQMKALENELDDLYVNIRTCASEDKRKTLLARQKKLEESMELMSQLLCFAKKV